MSTLEFNQLLLVSSDFLNPFAATLTRDKESASHMLAHHPLGGFVQAPEQAHGQGGQIRPFAGPLNDSEVGAIHAFYLDPMSPNT